MKTILLVDDEKDILEILASMLSSKFNVITAESSNEAFLKIEENPLIEKIITDFNVPGVAQRSNLIKLLKSKTKAEIYVMSGEDSIEISNLEINGYIPKPSSLQSILSVIS